MLFSASPEPVTAAGPGCSSGAAVEARIQARIEQWVRRHDLLAPGDRVLVAVSGGSDSTALLLLLAAMAEAWGLQLAVAHFDHGWRPESAADAAAVGRLAEALALPFHLGRHSGAATGNREQSARRARYAFLEDLAGAGVRIATAHTADDQAETVLLRLLRGAGPTGLAGILPRRALQRPGAAGAAIIRPLLCVTRNELRQWLELRHQGWREDETNRDCRYRRNWLRHQVLPALTAANPALVARLNSLAEVVRGEEEFWDGYLAPLMRRLWQPLPGGLRAARADFAAQPLAVQRRLLRAAVRSLQGDLRRLDYAALEEIAAWIGAAPARPRRRALAGLECRVTSRWIEVHPRTGV